MNMIPGYEESEYNNSIQGILVLTFLMTVLRLFLVFWVMKDSIERGMSSPPGWGLFAMFFPIIAMVFYYFLRTEGDLVKCEKCGQKMSEVLHECPRCKYRKETVKKRSWRRNNG
jgi:hypothetical protein